MTPRRVILDVDTGIDDAIAIALAVHHPEVQLEAVVTVAGNVGVDLTTRNTLRVLEWLGASSVPTYVGADGPLCGAVREASHWHGQDGLGGARLPAPSRTANGDGVQYLRERILAEPGELTLVCTAPLTNLALALQQDARIVENVAEVVLMGGVIKPPGNVTPVAEFNIYADPEAAKIVFDQPWKLTMVGLDVTNRVTFTRDERDALSSNAGQTAILLREVTRHPFDTLGLNSLALHDPLALALAIQPDLVTTMRQDVEVEILGTHTRGQTVVDLRRGANAPTRNTLVCTDIDVERAKSFILGALA